MKNLLLVPILALTVLAVGCGKNSSKDQGGGAVIVQPQPQPQPLPIPNPAPGFNFSQECQLRAGTTITLNSQIACQFTQGGNYYYAGIGNLRVNTGYIAYPYSHILINASESMNLYVGGAFIGKGQTLTNGPYTGNIGFAGDSLTDMYSVYAIQVTSAFNEAGQYVPF